ncbi:MAG: glucose 1-dehydrogenase [Phenylobacterium sp.]|uniref:glucose 1-dehydrogenase n=1 Tax=Phenylobacterium sp. TaxID=1871053 RepID=UPI0027345128|nr:glucose 1-dehydrogenase [Phenylobacterium sp.]MDP3745739.1 glucose 1-dehydrogenase [Phenylobacterium sp.]
MAAARAVIVTGGADGIGWAIARRFATAGDRVLIADRNGDAAQARAASLGAAHLGLAVDVSVEADVKAMVAACRSAFGRVDVLINNAGVIDAQAKPVVDQPLNEFRALIGVNVTGVFLAAREAGRVMLAQGQGAIVNLASGAGVAAVPFRNGYGASKAAVASLTRTLACEWAGRGVRVNAVAPGYTRTDMVERLIANGKVDPAFVERRIPLGRMAAPDEIAEAVFYLASDGASYVTGALLVADGGFLAFGGTGPASTRPAPHVPARGPRTVVVTGGASGIGRAVVDRFVRDGDRLLVIDRDAAALETLAVGLGPEHLVRGCDVMDEIGVEAAMDAAMVRWGRIDVLINNAGVADVFKPTVDLSTAEFQTVFDINLTGAFIASRAAGRRMQDRDGAAIVNLASIAGLAALPQRNAYCAAKAGVGMLTKSLACEWAERGIRVNAVAPGYIETPGLLALRDSGARRFADVLKRTPMGRLGLPREVADLVAFLAGDAASYVTGSVVSIDGGWHAFGDAGDASDG